MTAWYTKVVRITGLEHFEHRVLLRGGVRMPNTTGRYRNAESSIAGATLGLDLVDKVAALRLHNADRLSWHSHSCFEILLVTGGGTAYEIEAAGTVDLPGGHFLVVPPGTLHRGLHDLRSPADLVGMMVDFQLTSAARHGPFSLDEVDWLRRKWTDGAKVGWRMSTELKSRMKSLPRDFNAVDTRCLGAVASLRLAVCGILLEAASVIDAADRYTADGSVRRAIEYMELHLTDPPSVDAVAKVLNCSRAKLFDIFKRSTGMTPVDFWQRLRIDRAQKMIRYTDKSITEIAFDCGFSTSQYFSTVFRRYSGCSPSDFRSTE
jgi:AraC-like DNA-binding protein